MAIRYREERFLVRSWEATRFANFSDTDPANVALWEAARDAILSYETDRDATRASFRQRLIAASFTDAEIAAVGL